jgi:23S rRNA pseudouridine2605 synthase
MQPGTGSDRTRQEERFSMPQQKIQLIIRDAGLGSRRDAEAMVREGRVTLNGAIVEHPHTLADPEKDHIKVDGKLLRKPDAERLYYLFNKPRFVVSTMEDPEGRPCLGELLKPLKKRLFTVGRLDFDAEGLMILTNDGDLAHRLSHPSSQIPRAYLVKVRGTPDDRVLGRIRKGLSLGDGDRLGEVSWTLVKSQKTTSWIRLVLHEGKKNEIKRIFFHINHPVRRIRRVGFGPYLLGSLPVGTWRPFTPQEEAKAIALMAEPSPQRKPSHAKPRPRRSTGGQAPAMKRDERGPRRGKPQGGQEQ